MKRLPGTEKAATRLESGVFGSLALAGVAAILLALGAYSRFVAGQDAVVAALEGRPNLHPPVPADPLPLAPTNITRIETKTIAPADPDKV